MMERLKLSTIFIVLLASMLLIKLAYGDEEDTRNILKQGLLGAGVGAISSGASGGRAGQGALIGAGTSVIGSALLDAITGPGASQTQRRSAPPQDDEYYYTDEPEEYYAAPPPQESGTSKVLKQGLVGAGVGAISSGVSGGNAGQGALIGAGTSVIGNALLDTITQPPAERKGRVYRKIPRQTQKTQVQEEEGTGAEGTRKKIIRKYDENGKVISEEEIYY